MSSLAIQRVPSSGIETRHARLTRNAAFLLCKLRDNTDLKNVAEFR